MYFIFNEENEFHQKLNPVAMAKRQIPNGYKNTLKPIIKSIKPLKEIDETLDLYLDEDAHLRSRILSGEQNRKDRKKFKFRRVTFANMTPKDYDNFLKKNSSPREYREMLRNDNKQIKSLKKAYKTNKNSMSKTNDNTVFSPRSFIKKSKFRTIKKF